MLVYGYCGRGPRLVEISREPGMTMLRGINMLKLHRSEAPLLVLPVFGELCLSLIKIVSRQSLTSDWGATLRNRAFASWVCRRRTNAIKELSTENKPHIVDTKICLLGSCGRLVKESYI